MQLAFRVAAPAAVKRASVHEDCCPRTRPVVNGVSLNVEDQAPKLSLPASVAPEALRSFAILAVISAPEFAVTNDMISSRSPTR